MPDQSGEPSENKPVFYDPSRRRARLAQWAVVLGIVAIMVWAGLFWFSIFVLGNLNEVDAGVVEVPQAAIVADAASMVERTTEDVACGVATKKGDLSAPQLSARPDVVLQEWPEGAISVLAENCGSFGSIYLEWFRINSAQADVVRVVPDYVTDAALRTSLDPAGDGVTFKSIVQLPLSPFPGTSGLENTDTRSKIGDRLAEIAAANHYTEVCISPEGYQPWHLAELRAFLTELQPKLSAVDVKSCLVAEAQGPFWRDREMVGAVDTLLLLAFQLPENGSAGAPLAASEWFDAMIPDVLESVGRDRLRVALGAFGYLWREGNEPTQIAFAESMRLAAKHGGAVSFPDGTGNTRVTFADAEGRENEIWLLDAVSIWNQLVTLGRYGITDTAIWAASLEDPGVWQILQQGTSPSEPAGIEDVLLEDFVGYDGDGPFVRLTGLAAPGRRELVYDPASHHIVGQVYSRFPKPISMERFGRTSGKVMVLSFDDGPDETFTREILDILSEKRVPGAFFVIGSNMARESDLVRRMLDEGHEVGSHTFFHPDTGEVGEFRLEFEVNATQRLLSSITGRGTRLFRLPYGQSEGPLTAHDSVATIRLLDEGYFVVGSDIVPRDWAGWTPDAIVAHVLDEARKRPASNVIVMHDAGGNREATVAAVPRIIDSLRKEGYVFTSLGGLLDLDRDKVMPPRRDAMAWLDWLSFHLISSFQNFLLWVFWIAVLGGALRAVIILILALLRRPHRTAGDALPRVTVAIPAFNEAAGIESSVRSALASDYPDLKVVVIDDGSVDRTAEIVAEVFGSEPRVTLIRQKNQGKWKALDTAYRYFDTEIIVAVDADTRLQPDAIRLLAGHFRDPEIGAVAGNVKVGNRTGLLPLLQSLEYITAQNVDRRAAELLNAMLVVPGAIGAWRTEAVREAGLYSGNTIAEDADLTVSVLRAGYRIRFEPRAVSWTNAPANLSAFLRQRLRWIFGMMQTAWKHRGAMREGRIVGIVAIPDLWLAGIALSLLAPFADLVLIGTVAELAVDFLLGRPVLEQQVPLFIVGGYLLLPVVDLLAVALAIRFERSEPVWLILLVPLQRLVYRPLLYFTAYRAVVRAIMGLPASWGRLSGSAKRPTPDT